MLKNHSEKERRITEALFEVFQKATIKGIFIYGNPNGADTDIVLVQEEEISSNPSAITLNLPSLGVLEVSVFDTNGFLDFILHFDPLATDPLLTGRPIYGDKFESEKSAIQIVAPDQNAVERLLNRSSSILFWAELLLVQRKEIDSLHLAMKNIVFALSYAVFAKHYNQGGKIMTFKAIREKYTDSLMNQAHICYKSGAELSPEFVRKYLAEAKEFIEPLALQIYPGIKFVHNPSKKSNV